jgi:diacylglycerol kinase family enzyme
MPSKVLFIVNPISGTGKQKLIASLLKQHLNNDLFSLKLYLPSTGDML